MLKVVDVRDGLALGEIGPLAVAVWRSGVTRETFDRQSAALRAVVQSHPGAAGFLCIVETGAKPPDEALRRASAQMIVDHGDQLALAAAVIEGTGFQAAVTRSVLTTITMFMRELRAKVSFFPSVNDAAPWLCARIALPDPYIVARDVEALRAHLSQHAKSA